MKAFAKTHSKDEEKDEDISEIISNIMRMKMVHRPHRDTVLILDFLLNEPYDNDEEPLKYNVGSAYERSDIFGSDMDSLNLRRDLVICQSMEEVNGRNGVVFLMDRTNCYPGYTKLRLLKNDNCDELYQSDLVEEWYLEEGFYLLTDKFIDFAMEIMSEMSPSTIFTRRGPCVSSDMEPMFGFTYSLSRAADFAQGIEIQTVTKEGENWFKMMDSTQMERIWPTADTIKKIRALKNEVVAVSSSDDTTSDPHWKWRISYTLWERELMWSFKYVQIHCLVILKFFLKATLKTISEDITSYHLKNIVFWESAESSLEMFENRKLLLLVKKCLIRLKIAINDQRLPHFIDRDRNLFLFKLKCERAKLELISCLDDLIMLTSYEHLIQTPILKFFADGILSSFYYNKGCDPSGFLWKAVDERGSREECFERIIKCQEHGFNVFEIKYIVFSMTKGDTIRSFINTFDAMESIDVDGDFVKTVQNMIKFRKWLITAAKNPNMAIPCEYYTDALSGRLYCCTYLVKFSRFQEAADIICNFLETSPKLLIYCGFYKCGDAYNGIHVEKGQANHIQIENISIDVSDDPFLFIHDVIANPLEIDIFPPILQIQFAIDNTCIVLSPIVFMYYLKVICDIKEEVNADYSLQRLADTVNQYRHKIYDFRPLNMLGHAYLLTKRYKDAYRSFLVSIQYTYPRNYPNSVT